MANHWSLNDWRPMTDSVSTSDAQGPMNGESGFREGEARQALFKRPFGITCSTSDGALFVTDSVCTSAPPILP